MAKWVFFIFCLWSPLLAWAYPNNISYGYNSCVNCHFNPMGHGPLTDYGRAFSATEMSDRQFMSKSMSQNEEKLADQSGFFFRKPAWDWLRPSASFRGLYYTTNPGQNKSTDRFILMDASAALVMKFFEDDKLIFVMQGGYAPKPAAARNDGKTYTEYRSRELYMGYRFVPSFGMYAGLMDKAFGIRIPDHIAFSRSVTKLNQNDQTYGVLLHLLTDSFEWALQPFFGNLVQDEKMRQKGVTTQLGVMFDKTTRLGASFAKSNSEYLETMMYSIDLRAGFGESNSILFEVGQVEDTPSSLKQTTKRYILMQNGWRLRRGLSSILTVEMLQPDIGQNGEIYRFGPGIQYFPTNRIELRADIYDTRQHSSAAYTDDTWTVTGQMHLWF